MQFIDLKSQQARIRQDIDRRIATVLDHGQYILGPECADLESALSDRTEGRHTIGCSSGTDALLIALMALDVGPGDEVITVPYTWISTAEVIALLGAKPVFVDIDPVTWNLNPDLLEGAISDRTKAIIPVGIYGQPANLSAINTITEARMIPVIEDAAQCYGSQHRGVPSGALSEIATTSFFPSKPLGGYGDGGAIFTSNPALAEKMRWISIHGQARNHHHPILGLTARLDSMQAAVVLAKLEIFDEEIRLRQEVADRYAEMLRDCGATLPRIAEGNTSVWAQYTVLTDTRDDWQASLKSAEIPSVPYYAVPLHLQPVFSELGHREGDFPVTERVSRTCLSLPMSPYLSAEDQRKVAEVISSLA